jgi:ribosome-binding protein aMBF1 (putative translation factor)
MTVLRKVESVPFHLAHKVGVRESFVSDIENAKKEPCLEVIRMLAQGLGISLRRLFWDL